MSKFNNPRFGNPNNNPAARNNAAPDQFAGNQPKKRKKWGSKDEQDGEMFLKDDIEGYKPFKSFDHEIKQGFSVEDLMVKVNGRYPITLEFLEKLEITQLNSDEESDAVKTVVKKLCDLLHDYQLASLSEEEKEIVRRRGLLKT